MVSIASDGSVAPRLSFLLTSQTKPGPNMAFAVARKVVRRDSMEEKDLSISFRSSVLGPGACMAGVRHLKNMWLLWAMEAWLKVEAMLAWRPNWRTSCKGFRFSH